MTAAKFALPAVTLLLAVMLLAAAGCDLRRSTPAGAYETVPADPGRDTAAARRHNRRALELIERDQLPQAEAELKAALEADLFFAPAHNNLGTVYLRQEKYYLAAWQFQYAVKLTPNKAAPRNNLGLVFEAVGRLDDAADCYDKALALDADAVDIAANLARIHLRTGRKTPRTRQLLNDIILYLFSGSRAGGEVGEADASAAEAVGQESAGVAKLLSSGAADGGQAGVGECPAFGAAAA